MRGSFQNRMAERAQPIRPEKGMGATRLMYSDRVAGTIIRIWEKGGQVTAVEWQQDQAKLIAGNIQGESQQYEYTADPAGDFAIYTLRKDGTYVRQGDRLSNGERLAIGLRQEYRDPSF